MTDKKHIPDERTRAESIARLREVGLMFEALNLTLDEAIASAEADLRANSRNLRIQERAKPLFDRYRQKSENS